MRKLAGFLVSMAILLMASVTVTAAPYPGMIVIDNIEGSVVSGSDCNGNEWSFAALDDWEIGDFCAVIYDDAGTEMVYDDIILCTRYVGCMELVNDR